MGRQGIVTSEPIALPEHELLSRVFRTLGDATRLRLLEVLLEVGQATQTQLLERVAVSQPRVSEHLSCLTWCGFITADRHGRTVRYRVIDDRAPQLLELARSFLHGNETAVGCCTVLEAD